MRVPALDTLHGHLECLAVRRLMDGSPAFLFRGERNTYPHTLSSMDRHYHNDDLDDWAKSDLEDVTAFAMKTALQIPGSPDASVRLPPKLAGAFAQHYGLPTQVFDFTASPKIAIGFAANRSWHKDYPQFGLIGVLNVATLRASGAAEAFDLREFSQALRARKQEAFGVIYNGFQPDGFDDLKREEIAKDIGLEWLVFVHLPNDESYLRITGSDADLVDLTDDVFARVPQDMMDEFVIQKRGVHPEAARVLAQEIPAFERTKAENAARWTEVRAC